MLSPRSIEVSWDPPVANVDDVDGYTILYDGVESSANSGNVSVNESVFSVTISGLEEFVNYDVTVEAVYDGATSVVSSDPVRVQTYSDG